MEKQLKDYLHFYLGCDMYVFPPHTATDGWLKGAMKRIDGLGYKYKLKVDNLLGTITDEYNPILRPLSDMSSDEAIEYLKIYGIDAERIEIAGEEIVFPQGDTMVTIDVSNSTPECFKYLLSRHFDLFGLIEIGLAVDLANLQLELRS